MIWMRPLPPCCLAWKAVLDSEQRRETRVEQINTALTALVTQLQKLPLPREVARPLKTLPSSWTGESARPARSLCCSAS